MRILKGTYPTVDSLYQFLKTEGYDAALNDMMKQFMSAQGIDNSDLNQMLSDYLAAGEPVGVTVSISGTVGGFAVTGTTLTASGATTYQWQRNGVDIAGETGTTYTPTFGVDSFVDEDTIRCVGDGSVNSASYTVAYAAGSAAGALADKEYTKDAVIPSLATAGDFTLTNLTGTYSATGLPAGLAINSTTGAITGTPTANITSQTVTITFTDQYGRTVQSAFSMTVVTLAVTGSGASRAITYGADTTATLTITIDSTDYTVDTAANAITAANLGAGPMNLVLPVITDDGTPEDGDTITSTEGLWIYDGGVSAPTFANDWQADTAGNGTFADLGDTDTSYTLTSDESGDDVRFQVVATDANGSRTANSAAISVASAGGAVFNDALNTGSGAIEAGADWDLIQGASTMLNLGGGVLTKQYDGDAVAVVDEIHVHTSDHYAEIEVGSTTGSSQSVGLVLRATDSDNYFAGWVDLNTGATKIRNRLAGGNSDTTGTSVTVSVGMVVRFEISGTGLSLKVDGVERHTLTSSDHATGRPGIFAYTSSSSAQMNNFESGDV